jgi:hypothetical protein
MKFDYIKGKLFKLNYSNRDIEILISVKNENLLKKYFFGQGIREYSLLKILKNEIKKPIQNINHKTKIDSYIENEENPEMTILTVNLRHDWNGSLSVYGTSYSTYEVSIPTDFYNNAHNREIDRFIEERLDFSSLDAEEPSDYDTSDSVYWDSDFQTEIDDYEEN